MKSHSPSSLNRIATLSQNLSKILRESLRSAAPEPFESSADVTAARLFLGYRLFLATIMLVVFFGMRSGPLGTLDPRMFAIVIQLYAAVTCISLIVGLAQYRLSENQVFLAVMLDIAFVVLLMHASGGVQSGLGMLIAVSIALGSISLRGRTSLLLAALASLAVLGAQVYAHLIGSFSGTAYTQAGLLGISFFALAALAQSLASRALRNAQLVSEREADLAQLSQLNEHVIQQMLAGILVIDGQRIVQLMNESAWALLGMPQAMRHHPLSRVCSELDQRFTDWNNDAHAGQETFRARPGGRELRAEFTPLGMRGEQGTLIVLEDTAILNEQVQQMKLASLGRLTGGIAHEIRNPLGAISHAAQLLAESPDINPTDLRMMQIIQANSQRVNQVVQNILKLSRQESPAPKPLVLGPWLDQQVEQLRLALNLETKQISLKVVPAATTVFADAGQIRQIIEVLCDNAVKHFDRDIAQLQIEIRAGVNAKSGGPFIAVCDNGKGIEAQDVTQLFEPFFTTSHAGTGLGLYIARQMSEANRVRLDYQQGDPEGSCFLLRFPHARRGKQK